MDDPAQEEAWNSLKQKPSDYRRRVRHQVSRAIYQRHVPDQRSRRHLVMLRTNKQHLSVIAPRQYMYRLSECLSLLRRQTGSMVLTQATKFVSDVSLS